MSRVIAIVACGFMLTACSATMPSLSLDFMKSTPQAETLAIESEPPGAEAKTSIGQNCRTPCQLPVQPGREFSVTLALSGYQPQTVSVRPEGDGASVAPRLAPNPIHVTLQAVAPPKKPVLKKKKPVAAAARPAASRPVASAAPKAVPVHNTCACSCPAALISSGSGSIRDQLSLAVTIISVGGRIAGAPVAASTMSRQYAW